MSEQATLPPHQGRRIDNGKGHTYRLDGRPILGVTTILKKTVPAPALVGWAGRTVAEYAADHLEQLQDMDRDARVDLLKGAPYRERDKGANRGTQVHGIAQQLLSDVEVEVPEEIVGHVDSYLKFLKEWQPADILVERPCFNTQWQYAGTFDMICSLASLGRRCLVDIKTNRSGPFSETALQLCAYGHAEFYCDERGTCYLMPAIDWYGVLWLRADGYSLYPYHVTESEWRMFQHLCHAARWIDTRQNVVKGDELWPVNAPDQ